MRKKIVLIDGHSILNRAFYGVPDLTNAEGLHTNAVYGFLNILFKILEEEKPDYLTVAFDVNAPTFRHEMFEAYKGTRKPMAEELRQQVPVMKEVLRAMGVLIVEQPGFEADDLLGTLAHRSEQAGLEVVVLSGDRDLLQLATEHVKIRIPKTKQGRTEIEDYLAADVREKYQVTPSEFIDVKALMGDASDNIPGVPSIGEKTATKLIVEYGSIENAYAHIEEIKPPRAAKALREHYDLAQMSKALATIEVHAPMEYAWEQARLGNLYTAEAYEYFQRLQFKNLLGKFEAGLAENKIEEMFVHITKASDAEAFFARAKKAEVVGIAFLREAETVLPLFRHPSGFGGIGIAFGGQDIAAVTTEEDITMEQLFRWVERLASETVVSMFDIKEALANVRLETQENCFDVHIAAYLLNPLKNDYTCADIASEYLSLMTDSRTEEKRGLVMTPTHSVRRWQN